MKYRRLGATGLLVSEIGFGGWGIGGSVNGSVAYGSTDDEESRRTLRRAFELGVTFYDTSDFYGFGHSEELIGQALKGVRPRIVIATKVGLLDAGGRQDFSCDHIRRSIEASLKRLGTDYIDLYQLHSPAWQAVAGNDGLLSLAEKLKSDGKIRAIGISSRSPDEALLAVKHGFFECLQVNFNLVDQRALANGLFAACEQGGVGMIVRTPLCFGFLTGAYSADSQFEESDHRSRWSREQVQRWSTALQMFFCDGGRKPSQTQAQFALRFCLSYPAVSTAIPGMLKVEHVEENVLASALGGLSKADLDQVHRVYQENEFFCR